MLTKAAALLLRTHRSPPRVSIISAWRSMKSPSSSSCAASSHPKRSPHIVFTEGTKLPPCFNIFGLNDRKIRTLDPPTLSNCIGSGQGWLFAADQLADPYLFDPVTTQTLPLPQLSTLDHVVPIIESGRTARFRLAPWTWVGEYKTPNFEVLPIVLPQMLIHRALPIADPNGDLIVFIVLQFPVLGLAYARPGDSRWTMVDHSYVSGFVDVVCHQNLIFTVLREGQVVGWEFGGLFPTKPRGIVATDSVPGDHDPAEEKDRILCREVSFYLATTPSGDLLRVRMETVGDGGTICLKVHRVEDGENGRAELVEVKSLGENALLLGANSAICVAAADVPGLERDCVCFIAGAVNRGDITLRSDVGKYNMMDGSIEPISTKIPLYPRPMWIMGSFD